MKRKRKGTNTATRKSLKNSDMLKEVEIKEDTPYLLHVRTNRGNLFRFRLYENAPQPEKKISVLLINSFYPLGVATEEKSESSHDCDEYFLAKVKNWLIEQPRGVLHEPSRLRSFLSIRYSGKPIRAQQLSPTNLRQPSKICKKTRLRYLKSSRPQ